MTNGDIAVQTEGNLKQAGGTVKDKVGGLLGNDQMQAEGALQIGPTSSPMPTA